MIDPTDRAERPSPADRARDLIRLRASVLTAGVVPAAGVPMSAARFRYCLAVIGWTAGELSRRLLMDEASVRQMARSARPVPDPLAAWLERVAQLVLSDPAPAGWRKFEQ